MTSPTELNPGAQVAQQIAALVETRKQLKAAGADVGPVNAQIKPFKAQYVSAGAVYGGNYSGMVRWFAERALTA
jgi:hypothetical protein